MKRVLVIPAAGRGSRLGRDEPKLLVPVAGRPMIRHLLDRYRELVERFILVVSPDAEAMVRQRLAGEARVTYTVQPHPTGMLDAILLAREAALLEEPEEAWVTWCDQVAVGAGTVYRLAQAMATEPRPELAFPTVKAAAPYIHFDRDPSGTIVRVLQRREGDAMPADGEGDIGLFALTAGALRHRLPEYARQAASGAGTGERNFLPFIPWLAARALVRTISATRPIEAVGINTPDDMEMIEGYLGRED